MYLHTSIHTCVVAPEVISWRQGWCAARRSCARGGGAAAAVSGIAKGEWWRGVRRVGQTANGCRSMLCFGGPSLALPMYCGGTLKATQTASQASKQATRPPSSFSSLTYLLTYIHTYFIHTGGLGTGALSNLRASLVALLSSTTTTL